VLLYGRDRGLPRFEHSGPIPPHVLASREQPFAHPSATQIVDGVFPVGFTVRRARHGPSYIRFYALTDAGTLQPEPRWPSLRVADHIGALGWGQIAGVEYLVGCTWNCARVLLWRRDPAGSWRALTADRFRALLFKEDSTPVPRNYNSLYVTRTCTGERALLFASAEHWVDLWEILHLTTPDQLRLRHLVRITFRGTPRDLFHEGVSVVRRAGQVSLLAAPYDFGPSAGCADALCMPGVFAVEFVSAGAGP